jgi:hypothetical protein
MATIARKSPSDAIATRFRSRRLPASAQGLRPATSGRSTSDGSSSSDAIWETAKGYFTESCEISMYHCGLNW